METPITPSLRMSLREQFAALLPPMPTVPPDTDFGDFANADHFGDYDHALDARTDLWHAAALGALMARPDAFRDPHLRACWDARRFEVVLDLVIAHAAPPLASAGPFRVQLVPDPLRPEWSWEIYAPEQPIVISARPFSTPKEALEDALDHADAHGLPIAYAPVQVHLPRRSVGVERAKAA